MFDAISAATTGFLYVLNPYIPLILCFICCLISTILSLAFTEPISNSEAEENKPIGFIAYYKDTFITFKQILKSNRLKSLLIFSSLFFAMLCVFGTLRSSILVDIKVPEQYFGIVLAFAQITASLSSRKQQWFHNKLKNRALTWFSLSLCIGFILTGLLVVCDISFGLSLAVVLSIILLHSIVRGPYFTLSERYFNSFSNPEVNAKIFAIKQLLESIGRFTLSLFASYLLSVTTTSYAFIIIGAISFVVFIFLLNYMKSKVGLKPEEYPKEDLVFSNEEL